MAQLVITEQKAREIYPSASAEIKAILENTFTADFFKLKITDRVKSFADVCEIKGIEVHTLDFTNDSADEAAYKKLKLIVEVLNEGWKPNWDDSDEAKWYPWFYLNEKRIPYQNEVGFRLGNVYYYCQYSNVGSRLCFRSRELAEYAAKQFVDLYKTFFTY